MVTNVDEVTVRVVTPDVYAPFLEAFGAVPILPKHVLNRVPAGKFGSAYGIDTPPGQIVGSGPFRIKKFKPAEFTLLERNPYYYAVDQKGQRLPYLDNVIYTVVPDMNTMSERFIAGECDVLEMVRPDEYERYKTESAKGRFHLHDLGLGLERGFFGSIKTPTRWPMCRSPATRPARKSPGITSALASSRSRRKSRSAARR